MLKLLENIQKIENFWKFVILIGLIKIVNQILTFVVTKFCMSSNVFRWLENSDICFGEILHFVVGVERSLPYREPWSHFRCRLWQRVGLCRNVETPLLQTLEI